MNVVSQMKLFMEPGSVAIVGATRRTGPLSFNIVEKLLDFGFKGKIYPVNPEADQISGLKAYPSAMDIPGQVDLAVIPVWERSSIPDLVRQCTEKEIKAIVVVGQGFADADDEGRALQQELLGIIRGTGARLIGPNSLGVANPSKGLCTAFIDVRMESLPIGLICQSGLFFGGLPTSALLGKAIDIANASDIHFAEALQYYEDDPETKLIVLHIEGVRDGRGFIEVAHRVSRKKPIVALKVAKTEQGAKAAQSHTGTLAGRDDIFDAVLKQCGIVRAGDIDELADLIKAFLRLPPMRGRRVGIVSISGGAAIMAADACASENLEVARLSAPTEEGLQELSPQWMRATNPLDYWPIGIHSRKSAPEMAKKGVRDFLADSGTDAVIHVPGYYPPQDVSRIAKDFVHISEAFPEKPVCWWMSGYHAKEVIAEFESQGISVFPSCERIARVLAKLHQHWQFLQSD